MSYPIDSSLLINEFQDIIGTYGLNITKVPDYGPMMHYIEKFQSDREFEHLNDTSIDFTSITTQLASSRTQIRDMRTYNELLVKIIQNFRYKCLARCEINDVSILGFINAGIGGSTYRVQFDHKTIKYYSIDPTFLNNSKGSIPIVFKIIDDDGSTSNYKCEVLHEAAIGVALNSISHMTPNFMYFYGLLPCDFNYNIEYPILTTLDVNQEYPGFPVFEFIEGQLFYNWLSAKSATKTQKDEEDIKSVISQVLLSLYIANEMIDYTHFDLHYDNVMVIDLGTKKPIQYELPDGTIYEWETQYLAKIIDYGRNYAKVKDMEIFKNLKRLESFGIDAETNHQFDIVRFLFYVLNITQNVDVYNIYLNNFITGPFDFTTLDYVISNFIKFYNILPVNQRKLDTSLTGLDIVGKILGNNILVSGDGIDYDDTIFDKFIMKTKYYSMITLCPSEHDLLAKQKRRVSNLINQLRKNPTSISTRNKLNTEFPELYRLIESQKAYNESYYTYLRGIFNKL